MKAKAIGIISVLVSGAVVFGGVGAIVVTVLWAWRFPELRRVRTFAANYN